MLLAMTSPVFMIAIAVVVLVILAVRAERKRARAKTALLSTLGFQVLDQPDPQITEVLLALYRRGSKRGRPLRLGKVSHRASPAGSVYIFDVSDAGSSRASQVVSNAVGVVRPGARLPHFEIWAYAEGGGMLDQMMLGVVQKKVAGGHQVRFDDQPEFGRRFTVFAPDEDGDRAVRSYLTLAVRRALMNAQFLALVAGGDAFALQGNPFSATNRGDEMGVLRQLVDEALRQAEVLAPGPFA